MIFVDVILSVFFLSSPRKSGSSDTGGRAEKPPSPTGEDPETTLAPTRESPFKSINQNIICTRRT